MGERLYTDDEIDHAKTVLAHSGFVVLREKSYRQAQERQRVAEVRREWAEENAESARSWAVDCCNEERRLRDRLEQILAFALEHGATYDDLRAFNTRLAEPPVEPVPKENPDA